MLYIETFSRLVILNESTLNSSLVGDLADLNFDENCDAVFSASYYSLYETYNVIFNRYTDDIIVRV